MRKLFFASILALAAISCTKNSLESDLSTADGGQLSFVAEDGDELFTKSYLSPDGSLTYSWETDDQINFVSKRYGQIHQSGIGVVTKKDEQTIITLNASKSFRSGDVVYAYFNPAGGQPSNATTVQLSIPADQYTVIGQEKFITTETVTTDPTTVALSVSGSLSATSATNQASKTPKSSTLTIAIQGYDSSMKYTYSTDGSSYKSLSVGSNGSARITVSYPQMSFSSNSGSLTKTVYVKCQSGTAAQINIAVQGKKTSYWGSSRYSYTYSIGNVTAGSYVIPGQTTTVEVVSYSSDKQIDARDAMPLVAAGVSVSSSMASGKSSITAAMSFQALASAVELRIYSLDSTIGVGEVIESVELSSTSAAVSGTFNYDLTRNPLTISGLQGHSVTAHVEEGAFVVPGSRDDYTSLSLIVAPGTYDASVTITTDKDVYTIPFSSRTYTRAVKEVVEIDLSDPSVARQNASEPEGPSDPSDDPSDPTDPDQPGTPDEPTDPSEPDQPGTPDEPTDPSEPDQPGTPDEPTDPSEPDQPGTPDEPTDPSDPDQPGTPDEPTDPSEPDQPSEPEVPEYSWETSYAVFASDRHGNTSAISSACNGMSVTNPYVCLVGDMVGAGTKTDAPAYNSSTVKAEVDAVFSNATTQIVWGLHDGGVHDDAGIVVCEDTNSSGLIYTATDSRGNVQYYVYAIAYNDIADSSTTAQANATAFENWVSTISDTTIPIFVVSHVPLHAKRKDNYGAYYWNRAITYAATGSETGTVSSLIRNVIFVHGHNHTSETTEYYYEPGTRVKIAKKGGDVTCNIPYTYLTGGYLKSSPTKATLVQVNETTITLTKYSSGTGTLLGTITRVSD